MNAKIKEPEESFDIVVDDGAVKQSIKNKFGDEIGVFYFRPTDLGIVDRYNRVAAEFDKITEPLEHVDVKADGTVDETNEAAVKALGEAKSRLFRACDYLFGGNFSEAFFGKMEPFSPIGGNFYCENALSAVGGYLSKKLDVENKRIAARVGKYTDDYKRSGGEK